MLHFQNGVMKTKGSSPRLWLLGLPAIPYNKCRAAQAEENPANFCNNLSIFTSLEINYLPFNLKIPRH